MAVELEIGVDISQTDDIHQLALTVIREITETFQQIQAVVAKRKTLLLREVSLMETKLRREKCQRYEDVNTLVRARESLEETLNTNKYKDLRDDLLVRLDNSLEKENEQSKSGRLRFISRGFIQLKDCISKFGVVVRNSTDDPHIYEDDDDDTFHSLTLPLRNLASPRMSRKWTDPGKAFLGRQTSTPSYLAIPLSPTSRPRGFSKPIDTSTNLSHSLSFNNRRENAASQLGLYQSLRKNSFNN